ncbi:MAG: cupin domain-containing protein [Thermodesulfobacteriota bacterium]
MKIYKLPMLADSGPSGEYRLGPEEAATDSVYILYGRLRPGETNHKTSLPEGHEEIICVVKGTLRVTCCKRTFDVSAGEAFNPRTSTISLDNAGEGEAIFISARGCPASDAPNEAQANEPTKGEGRPEEDAPAAAGPEEEDDGFVITNDGIPLED